MIAPKIILAIPWIAISPKSLFSDSGFLTLYEPLIDLYNKYKIRTIMVLEPRYRLMFESKNIVENTGCQAVYVNETRTPAQSANGSVDNSIANAYISGIICPVDLVFMNREVSPVQIAGFGRSIKMPQIPIILQQLSTGIEGVNIETYQSPELNIEAFTLSIANRVLWPTKVQKSRALTICRRFLSSSECLRIIEKSVILGHGIPRRVLDHQYSDMEVKTRLTNKVPDFFATYIGRVNSTKNVSYIFDSLRPLFITENIKLKMVVVGIQNMPKEFSKFSSEKDASSIVLETEFGGTKGRDYYFSTILPSQRVVVYASLLEGYCIVPREVVAVGVPCMLPKRDWALAIFPDTYPFFYDSDTELIVKIKRIQEGRVSEKDIDNFLSCRRNLEFTDTVVDSLYSIFSEEVTKVVDRATHFSHNRCVDGFKALVEVSAVFNMKKLVRELYTKGYVELGQRPMVYSPVDFYRFIHEYIEVVDPIQGNFLRRE